MGTGGPTVTVHVDEAFTRDYRRALVRERRRRWILLGAFYAAFGVIAVAWYLPESWGMAVSLVMFVGIALYGEGKAFRRDADLPPVGLPLVAEFDTVSLVIRRADRRTELPYAYFRELDRDGVLIRLEDGTKGKVFLPSALFPPEAEAWFRQLARSRDLAAEALPPGWRELDQGDRVLHRMALAGVRRFDLREWGWPLLFSAALCGAAGLLLSPRAALLLAGFFVLISVFGLGQQYSVRRKRLEFQYVDQPVRVGSDGEAWVVDSVNWRERIDPAEVTYFERHQGLVLLCHTTAGEKRSLAFPEPWVAGLLAPERATWSTI